MGNFARRLDHGAVVLGEFATTTPEMKGVDFAGRLGRRLAAPSFVQRRRSAQNVGVGQPISRYRFTLEGDPNQSKMRAAIIAIMMVGLVVFLTSGSGWAQKDPPADAKQLAPPSPGGFVPDKLLPPPRRGRKEAKPLPKLSSKKRCLSKLDAGNYCYEVCDLEGGKKCRWVTPAEYMAHLEKRKPPSLS